MRESCEAGAGRPSLLLVSYYFPPYNAIASVRTGKMARFLVDEGWNVRVLTAYGLDPKTLPVEVDPSIVTRTEWRDIDKAVDAFIPAWIKRQLQRTGNSPTNPGRANIAQRFGRGLRSSLGEIQAAMVQWPDKFAGWRRPAVEAGARILADWKPDLIYASAPPATSLLIADDLSRRFGIPWVVEFRDLWVDGPYYQFGPARRAIERIWERRVIRRAAAIVTVSPQWRDMLEAKYRKSVALIMNGFDPHDFPATPASRPDRAESLHILFTGHIYTGYRDPTPLFEAMRLLGPERSGVLVEFIGTNTGGIVDLACDRGVEDRVVVRAPVPYRESLALQMAADVLLHLQWNHPTEAGTIPGKLFEYIGARRPILAIGCETGSVARIIREREAGLLSNDPVVIADQLRRWMRAKRASAIAPLSPNATAGLARSEQYAKLSAFLRDLALRRPARRADRVGENEARDSFGLRRSRRFEIADLRRIVRPHLAVVVDTEEEFHWDQPFSRTDHGVESIRVLNRAQLVFKKWGIVPTYVVDYPVATSDIGRHVIGRWLDAGECEIGAHLHPWVNPPETEEVSNRNSYPGNLPAELERAKLSILTERIERAFGARPVVYRAGRYGLGPHSLAILEDLGYLIDLSVVPLTSFASENGPDFTGFGSELLWFGERQRMLEIPVTRGFVGSMRGLNFRHLDRLDRGILGRVRVTGLLSRSGVLERLTLTPEGNRLDEMRRLCQSLFAAGQRVFVLSFHSPSLLPGNTQYVRDENDLAAFIGTLDGFFAYFTGELRGVFSTPTQIYRMLDRAPSAERQTEAMVG